MDNNNPEENRGPETQHDTGPAAAVSRVEPCLMVENLSKSFGGLEAVRGVSLSVG